VWKFSAVFFFSKVKDKRLIYVVLILGVAILVSLYLSWKLQSSRLKQNPGSSVQTGVGAGDIQKVGYIIDVDQSGLPNNELNSYFRVKEYVLSDDSKTRNIVFISRFHYFASPPKRLPYYGSNIRDIEIAGVDAQEGQMPDGRISVNFVKGKEYVILVGPNAIKLRALAQIILQHI
jgi:hypothetical protein